MATEASIATRTRASFGMTCAHLAAWRRPVQGSIMPVPAAQLSGATAYPTNSTSADAAKGATRKDATGGGAFEDPV